MSRLKKVQEFIEYDLAHNLIIEPADRYDSVRERLFDVINTHKPGVIVKAGLGSGTLLLDIFKEVKATIIVVEPSFAAITDFLKKYDKDYDLKNIRFINGEFSDFPIDYFACDLLICVDYLDFFDSGMSINEFRRALKFDGVFFFSSVVLDNDDIDGIYDEFIKMIFPLHNDYYLAKDITTFLELKEFSLVKNMILKFKINLREKIDHYSKALGTIPGEKPAEFIMSNKDIFRKLLNLDDDLNILERYYLGVYTRQKSDYA